jgi:pimeloyl-ACP methyl ester carboxylesterase
VTSTFRNDRMRERGPRSESWRRPPTSALALEGVRAAGELSAMGALIPLLRRAPTGDGHPVLVLPGFTAGDRSTVPLRWFLRDRGYFTHGWRLGRNLGPTDRIIDGMRARVEALLDQHGQRITIVGWSLGGIYAREIARGAPDAVRQVITLGSPFRLTGRRGASNAEPLFKLVSPLMQDAPPEQMVPEDRRPRLPVPATAVYTRTDGVVPWQSCVESDGPRRESIEVRGSHSGLGHNPAVLLTIADRLAQRDGTWSPFTPTSTWRRLGGVGTS